ncbi:MAG: gamma-glutamyltransferase [Gammaproteobacteria bacterium]|nr:gamma-glutamyltransferase [Gammaproteobacteria bacterium]
MNHRNALLPFIAAFIWTITACAVEQPGEAAIASAHPLATQAGYEVLEAGGNAFDAAVAVSAVLGVVEPYASGLGGGAFFLLHVADEDRNVFVDARETAPGASSADMYLDVDGQPIAGASYDGPLAAGIPGQAAGLVHLTEKYGQRDLAANLQSAIRIAEQGVPVHRRMLLGLKFRRSAADRWPAIGEVYYPDGVLPELGDTLIQKDLAATLRRFAKGGSDEFYSGETARLLVQGNRAAGGIWTREDLENYRVIEREPLTFNYRGTKFISAPPPSSGGIAMANMLNILNGYPLDRFDDVTRKHLAIEAMRRAFRDRAEYLGDTDFVDVPVELLMSPDYAAGQRSSIRLDRATPSEALADVMPPSPAGNHTTHFSIIDAQGNRVAATMTVNTWYGSAYMAPGTGIILNNEMDDFAVKPKVPNSFDLIGSNANAIEPGKRPLSSMSPTFLESEEGVAVLGTPGGSRIISMVLLAAMEWIDGADAEEIVSMKRYHHQYYPDRVNYEAGAFTAEEVRGLEMLGHELSESRRAYGNMNIVTQDSETGEVKATTDPRAKIEGRVY